MSDNKPTNSETLSSYIKYALNLIFKHNTFYKFKFLTITAIGLFFYNYKFVFTNKENDVKIAISNENNFNAIEVITIIFFAILLVLFDLIQNKHSQKIFGDIVNNKDLEIELRRDAMNKLKDIQ